MHKFYHIIARWVLVVFTILTTVDLQAQVVIDHDNPPVPDNEFTIDTSGRSGDSYRKRSGGY